MNAKMIAMIALFGAALATATTDETTAAPPVLGVQKQLLYDDQNLDTGDAVSVTADVMETKLGTNVFTALSIVRSGESIACNWSGPEVANDFFLSQDVSAGEVDFDISSAEICIDGGLEVGAVTVDCVANGDLSERGTANFTTKYGDGTNASFKSVMKTEFSDCVVIIDGELFEPDGERYGYMSLKRSVAK